MHPDREFAGLCPCRQWVWTGQEFVPDRDGQTPLELAKLRNYDEMVSILEEALR